jgi:hypothetical protein
MPEAAKGKQEAKVTRPDSSYLSPLQVRHLLQMVNALRVQHANGRSNMAAYDIRAHMNRIFGFGRWSGEVTSMELVYEAQATIGAQQKPGYDVCYKAGYRLTVAAPDGTQLATYTEYAVGAQKMGVSSRGDCHDFAMKTAESQALKRAATNLGDQFGLSLYNKGSYDPIVMGTLVWPGEIIEELPEIKTQLAEDTDPDGIPEVQRDEPATYSPVAAEQGGSGFTEPVRAPETDRAATGAQPATQPATEAPAPQPAPAGGNIAESIAEIRESIGFLAVPARGRLQILWKRANLTPLAHITTEGEIAAAWELYAQVMPGAPESDGPPAVLEQDAAVEARRRQVEQAERAFYGNRDEHGDYNPDRNT